MNVQVTEWYVPTCTDCIGIIENLVQSAVRDNTVTKVSISAGHQHCHPTAPKQKRVGADAPAQAAPALDPPSGELFTAINSPEAPLNGFDPMR